MIKEIQHELKAHNIEGWLLYDFHGSNPLALKVLQVPEGVLMTRRCFYWIPQEGAPIKIVHKIEANNLDHLPGEKRVYLTWDELQESLQLLLNSVKEVAMEYSPNQAIPTISKIDGGLIDLIRSFEVEVVSSAPFLQTFTCVWTQKQYDFHKEAANVLDHTVNQAWQFITKSIKENHPITEYQVQQFILKEFEKAGCVTEGVPICAVNGNAADPHYHPTKHHSQIIKRGDFVLIDLWCKKDLAHAVFADITRVGVVREQPTPKEQEVFSIVRKAQKLGTDMIIESYRLGKKVKGADIDIAVHQVIEEAGYGDYFTHRTGHNIHTENHGPGANLDGIETLDERLLIPRTCFSIEPGIYLPKQFGVRLEYDLFIHEDGDVEVTVPTQEKIVTLL